jgi:DNA-binding IclR family transcriptional regulator
MTPSVTVRAPGARRSGIQSIARAAQVLRALQDVPGGIGLAELAQRVALPKSTVHRLVGALSQEDLLAAGPAGLIVLGGGLAALAAAAEDAMPRRVRPVLEDLSRRLGETVDLAVIDGAHVRFVDQVPGAHRLRAVSAVGAEFPLYCTANGKALLAEMPSEAVTVLLPARLRRFTPRTIVSRAALIEELAEVRRRGIAFDREEHTDGICAVGAVIHGAGGPAAALSVPAPAARFQGAAARYGRAVAAAAHQASELLSGAR